MSPQNLQEAATFLAQADLYLKTVELTAEQAPHAACFYSHQAAEMAFKGLFVANGLYVTGTHSLSGLIDGLYAHHPELPELRRAALCLDPFYIGTRYFPRTDSFSGVAPAERYSPEIAREAQQDAQTLVRRCAQLYGRMVREASREGADQARPTDPST